jgi:hypothetical protein
MIHITKFELHKYSKSYQKYVKVVIDRILKFYYITPQGYIGNIVSNLIKFSCYIMLRSLTYDRTRLVVMNPWPTNENDAAFYYCVVIKTNFFIIKISLTVTGQTTTTTHSVTGQSTTTTHSDTGSKYR